VVNSNGSSSSYSNVSEVFSNQSGFSVDRNYVSIFDIDNAVLTGFDDNKVGIIHLWDTVAGGDFERMVLSNMEQLPNGDLQVDRLELFLDSGETRLWERYTETLEKQ
jgi:hypothetical protein